MDSAFKGACDHGALFLQAVSQDPTETAVDTGRAAGEKGEIESVEDVDQSLGDRIGQRAVAGAGEGHHLRAE